MKILLFTLGVLLPAIGFSQPYSIDWYTIDGGGGTSSNGQYVVSGTIGQPDAGTMSGGSYSVTGGFWSLLAVVQTPGAPLLSIQRTATNTVLISWPVSSPAFNLQQELGAGNRQLGQRDKRAGGSEWPKPGHYRAPGG